MGFPKCSNQRHGSCFFFGKIQPLSQVSGESPFEFKISGQNSAILLDLRNSQIYVRLKVTKADGTALTTTDKVGPANVSSGPLFYHRSCIAKTKPPLHETTIHTELTFPLY